MAVALQQERFAPGVPQLEDFEERIMFGDLAGLLADLDGDRNVPQELVQGLETLKYFREFYENRRAGLRPEDRTRLAAYDAAWCLELIALADGCQKTGARYQKMV